MYACYHKRPKMQLTCTALFSVLIIIIMGTPMMYLPCPSRATSSQVHDRIRCTLWSHFLDAAFLPANSLLRPMLLRLPALFLLAPCTAVALTFYKQPFQLVPVPLTLISRIALLQLRWCTIALGQPLLPTFVLRPLSVQECLRQPFYAHKALLHPVAAQHRHRAYSIARGLISARVTCTAMPLRHGPNWTTLLQFPAQSAWRTLWSASADYQLISRILLWDLRRNLPLKMLLDKLPKTILISTSRSTKQITRRRLLRSPQTVSIWHSKPCQLNRIQFIILASIHITDDNSALDMSPPVVYGTPRALSQASSTGHASLPATGPDKCAVPSSTTPTPRRMPRVISAASP